MSGPHGRLTTGPAPRLAAWSVHTLTASGALCGLLALDAIARFELRTALGWMAIAALIDGVDGALARRVRAREVLPAVDGALLDNIVDYLNYVIVPAFLVYRGGLLPEPIAPVAAGAMCVASAFQFSHVEAKTADHFFRGFPSYWNVVVCYLVLLSPDPRGSLAIVAALCVLVFAPVRFVYPTRTPELRRLTLVVTFAWAAALLALLWRYPEHSVPWTLATLAYVAYYLGVSLWLRLRHPGGLV